jgi:hypothetical protein
MKTKITLALVASIIFIAGYFLGCNQTKHSMRESWMNNFLFWRRVDSDHVIEATVSILTQFREGDSTNGLVMLEKVLDGNIMESSAIDVDLKETNGVSMYLREAHDYRAKYPWTNSITNVAIKVQNILSRAN